MYSGFLLTGQSNEEKHFRVIFTLSKKCNTCMKVLYLFYILTEIAITGYFVCFTETTENTPTMCVSPLIL